MKDLEFSKGAIGIGKSIVRHVKFEASEIGLDLSEIRFVQPIEGQIEFFRLTEDLFFKGELRTSVRMTCRRCVDPFVSDLKTTFSLRFSPTVPSAESDDLTDRSIDGEVVNLTEDAQQSIVLEVPCWPLCQRDCQGLCSSCGINLKDQNCFCQTDLTETSPFGGLQNMLQSANSQEK